MWMSCNGCRVLRKDCSENCSIGPCLQWIKSSESQANATVFLAKFYGRAGIMNLINSGPEHLRPAIFRSLLYEACGRIVKPIFGSVGLIWAENWQLCQVAVEDVLKGAMITPIAYEAAANRESNDMKSIVSVEMAEAPVLFRAEPELGLNLKKSALKEKSRSFIILVNEEKSETLEFSFLDWYIKDFNCVCNFCI